MKPFSPPPFAHCSPCALHSRLLGRRESKVGHIFLPSFFCLWGPPPSFPLPPLSPEGLQMSLVCCTVVVAWKKQARPPPLLWQSEIVCHSRGGGLSFFWDMIYTTYDICFSRAFCLAGIDSQCLCEGVCVCRKEGYNCPLVVIFREGEKV